MPTVCLNMIVKNERHVLERCFESLRGLIDHWVIVDTGSTDGTQALITDWFQRERIPGSLFEEPWRDFGFNRSRALAHARGCCDYTLVMDADDILEIEPGFRWPSLTADAYRLRHQRGGVDYDVERLVRSDQPWRYEGVLHEYLTRDGAPTIANLTAGVRLSSRCEGARSQDPQKYARDAAVLQEALAREPDNLRYQFYLAQSHRDAGNLELALEAYQTRARAHGWAEERFYAKYQVACLLERLGAPTTRCLDAYLEAWRDRPHRLEALHGALRCCRRLELWSLGAHLASEGSRQARNADLLFVEPAVYRWMVLDEWAVALTWIGKWRQALELNVRLAAMKDEMPTADQARVAANTDMCRRQLGGSLKAA